MALVVLDGVSQALTTDGAAGANGLRGLGVLGPVDEEVDVGVLPAGR